MVILGGLELVAAGYLMHQHNKNKKDRQRIDEAALALEEQGYPLQEDGSHRRHHRRHSHDRRYEGSHSYDREGKHRRHRSESRDGRHRREKEEYVPRPGNSSAQVPTPVPAATAMYAQGGRHSAPPAQRPIPPQGQAQYPPTGWPQHWPQTQIPPPPPNPPQSQAAPVMTSNGYPADVKYGFDPSIPHEQYPQPPAYQTSSSSSQPNLAPPQANMGAPRDSRPERRGRGRSNTQRSVSPNLGLYDENEERMNPNPRVRFAADEEILRQREYSGGLRSPPPEYRA